ncbi:MAG: murein biosynthesis integral membrane protein MurJ, partial [Anaerotignum sp.]|nr:murein biosynthesis integral membrane protein MurJ [Anaerotignum sp.]
MSEKGNQAVKTVSFMMLITLFGKILGLVREQFLAAKYATGMEAAAFLLASRIPRTFFDVIFASAISASFIPIFVEYLQKYGKEEAYRLANRFITMISTVTVVMMVAGMVLAEPLTWLIAPGYDVATAELCVELLRMLFPTMLFTAVAFSFVGILQSLDEFNIPAALSVASNGVLILYYIFFNEKFGIYGLTIAFLIGWAMQAIMQIPSLHQKGYHYKPDFHFKDEGLKKIGKLMLPVMVSTWIQPINFMVNTRFASQLSSGNVTNGELGVSALEYANNLYTIIVGVFVLAIANMVFPKFSRMTEDKKEFGLAVRGTLKAMIFLLIPMTVGLMALAEPVVTLIYKRGQFDGLATELTSAALFFFALGMVGYGVQNILSRAFYANQDGKTPFYSGLVSIIINALMCWLLLKPMGIGGLALAAAVSSTAAAAVLMVPAVKQYPDILDKSLVGQLLKMFLAAMGMLVLVLGCRYILNPLTGRLLGQIILLCVCGGVGVVSYMVFAKILRIEESDFVFDIIRKILGRGKGGETAGAVPAVRKRRKRRTYTMIEKMSFLIEDSFCFRFIERIWNVLAVLWTDSIAGGIWAKICKGCADAFEDSAILNFLRANWDKHLHTERGILPRFWNNLTNRSGLGVRRRNHALAAAMGESFIFRLFNQNFLVLCLAAIAAAIPVLPTMLLAVLVLGTFALYFIQLFLGRVKAQKTTMVSVLLGCFAVCIVYAGTTSYA